MKRNTKRASRTKRGAERKTKRRPSNDTERTYEWPRIRDLPKSERAAFTKWLAGQTCPFVTGVPVNEQDFYYPWDYESYMASKAGKRVLWD